MNRSRRFTLRIPRQLYLWLAVLIFGASNSVTQKVTAIGSQHFVEGQNPISLCNVLFVGNLCALLVFSSIHWSDWRRAALKQLSQQQWLGLIAVAILEGAIAPALIFQALALTMVNNVVLVGQLEPPLALALSVWLLKERVNLWRIVGAAVSFVGVILTISLQPNLSHITDTGNFFHTGIGEILTAVSTIALSASTIVSKLNLSQVPLGIHNVFSTALATIIFFIFALLIYGKHHFTGVFSPFLWQWMLIYGSVIVVAGQSFWITGLKASSISVASLASSFTPVAGILAAYLILGEAPTPAQYIGGGVILVGILFSQVGMWRKKSKRVSSTENLQEIENGMGFKGL